MMLLLYNIVFENVVPTYRNSATDRRAPFDYNTLYVYY